MVSLSGGQRCSKSTIIRAHLKMPDYIKNFEREIEMKRSTVDDAHLRCKEALVRVMKQGIGDLPDAEIIKDEIETLEEDVQSSSEKQQRSTQMKP